MFCLFVAFTEADYSYFLAMATPLSIALAIVSFAIEAIKSLYK